MTSLTLWQRIRRTPYQALAGVFMIFITLFVLGIFFLILSGASAILSYFESKPQLTVFFQDVKDKTAIDQLTAKLMSTGKVSTTNFVSKEQALAIYREQNKTDPLLLEMVTADILPASLEISATSPHYLVELAEIVKKEPGIDDVVLQQDVVDTLISWTTAIRRIGLVLLVFLSVTTFFIIFTSIGMKIALHREEIDILKLVGATPWYIKKPFIYEGIAYGIMGATFAWIIISGIVLYMRPFMTDFLKGIPALPLIQTSQLTILLWPPEPLFFVFLALFITFAGLLIGLISSSFAVSRYMKY